MAELLVIVKSKVNSKDALSDSAHWKRGDVVVRKPDGWAWSEREKTSEMFRIISVSLIVSKLEALEAKSDSLDIKGVPHRLRMLDFDSLPLALAVQFNPPRGKPIIELTTAQLDSITVLKS